MSFRYFSSALLRNALAQDFLRLTTQFMFASLHRQTARHLSYCMRNNNIIQTVRTMESHRIWLAICIILLSSYDSNAINARTLRKINLRFDKLEADYHRRISSLELEVSDLRIELYEQRTKGDAPETILNSSESSVRTPLDGESHGRKIFTILYL